MQELNDLYTIPSPLRQIQFDWATERNLKFFVKRDDLIHDVVSGNKWRKLKYNILQTKHLKKEGILTFGGAYSNHLLATAHVCFKHGLKSIGIVRGGELNEKSNSILKKCSEWGMQLQFISREEYRIKDDWDYLNEIKSEYHTYFIVPEGGRSFLGIIGCQEIVKEITESFNEIWVAAGTTTTAIGLALACADSQTVHLVPVLSGFDSKMEIEKLLNLAGFGNGIGEDLFLKMKFHTNGSFGGYGKTKPELLDFIHQMKDEINLPLDPIYTGKAFHVMLDYYQTNAETDKIIVFLHTGGLIAGEELLTKKKPFNERLKFCF